jgi:dihydrolipoamide dehydrogenase
VLQRKDAIIAKHVKGLDFLMKKHKITRHRGLLAADRPGAGRRAYRRGENASGEVSQVKAKNVILATGSEAKMLPGLKPDDRILTNIEILAINRFPSR